jgi:hypothetical protein
MRPVPASRNLTNDYLAVAAFCSDIYFMYAFGILTVCFRLAGIRQQPQAGILLSPLTFQRPSFGRLYIAPGSAGGCPREADLFKQV